MNNGLKIFASFKKDFLLLTRDYVSLLLLFFLPVVMVVLITSVQIAAFDLINKDQINLLVVDNDHGPISQHLKNKINQLGRFHLAEEHNQSLNKELLKKHKAYVAIEIPPHFSDEVKEYRLIQTQQMLTIFGLTDSTNDAAHNKSKIKSVSVKILFDPVMKTDFKTTIIQSLNGLIQLDDSEQMIASMYHEVNGEQSKSTMSISKENAISFIETHTTVNHYSPNATQHNIPAWSLFAMFFMVVSLGSTIVKEKTTGSFLRLKLMPTPFYFSLIAKFMIYFLLACFQIALLFGIGFYLFPLMDMPQLNLDLDILKLIAVVLTTSTCAILYAITIGLYANTVEQSNGFGAISVVILSVLGGVMVPSFAMPSSLLIVMKLSPIYWSLNAFYDVFLTTTSWSDLLYNLFPLFVMLMVLFFLIVFALKRKKLY
jgi:ABC-2 type transport system permease protein